MRNKAEITTRLFLSVREGLVKYSFTYAWSRLLEPNKARVPH